MARRSRILCFPLGILGSLALMASLPDLAAAQSAPPAPKKTGAAPTEGKAAARKARRPRRRDRKVEAAPPAGFEKLLKPQRTLVDLFHANRRIGQTFAVYKPGAIRFETPAAVVKLVGVREKQTPLVMKALSGWLNTNVGLVCSQTFRQKSCGGLSPKVAGVIFNEARLKVSVFVKPTLLKAQDKWRSKFLRTPSKNVSFLSQFDGSLAGQSQSATSRLDSNLRMLNLLSWRNFRFRSQTNTSPVDGVQVETLAFEWDRRGWAARAGVIRSTGSLLLPEVTLFGGHVGTSIDTRIDLDHAFGSQLSVFLRRQAIVEIIRDGRVLSARFYPSGNQLLDTGNLPSGAYTVTLRIRETNGTVREETRFFSKSSQIPPKDLPLIFGEAGVIGRARTSGLPERSDLPYYNFGGRVRIRDNIAIGGQVSTTDREVAGEVNFFFLSRYFRINLSGLGTSKTDWGVGGGISGTYKKLNGSINARYIRGPATRVTNPTHPATFRFVGERSLQITGSLSYQFRKVDFGLTASVTDIADSGRNWTINPRVIIPLWRRGGHRLSFIGDAAFGNRDIQVLGKLVYRWNRPKYAVEAEAGARYRRSEDGNHSVSDVATIRGIYHLPDYKGHNSTTRVEARRDNNRTQFGAGARTSGPFGRYSASANHSRGGDSANTSYTATMSVGLAIDRRGIAIGGRTRTEAAVIIKIRGADKGAKFHVLIDGQPRQTFRGDTTKPIFLRPYRKYRLAIRPIIVAKENSFSNVDTAEREVILYPGTVRTIQWAVVQVYVVFGRAVAPSGTPIKNAEIKGVNGIAETGPAGYFQAEIKSTAKRIRFLADKGRVCVAPLPPLKARNGYIKLGDIACDWQQASRTPPAKQQGKRPTGAQSWWLRVGTHRTWTSARRRQRQVTPAIKRLSRGAGPLAGKILRASTRREETLHFLVMFGPVRGRRAAARHCRSLKQSRIDCQVTPGSGPAFAKRSRNKLSGGLPARGAARRAASSKIPTAKILTAQGKTGRTADARELPLSTSPGLEGLDD